LTVFQLSACNLFLLNIPAPSAPLRLPANLSGGLARQYFWRACPPIFVEGLPAYLCGGVKSFKKLFSA